MARASSRRGRQLINKIGINRYTQLRSWVIWNLWIGYYFWCISSGNFHKLKSYVHNLHSDRKSENQIYIYMIMQSITSPHCSEYIVMSGAGDWRRLCILVFVIVILNSLLVLLSDVEIRTAISGLWIENLKMLHICSRDKASLSRSESDTKEVYSLDSTFLLWSIFLVYPALEDMTETILTYKRFSKTNFTYNINFN